jgi:hypothetical protein
MKSAWNGHASTHRRGTHTHCQSQSVAYAFLILFPLFIYLDHSYGLSYALASYCTQLAASTLVMKRNVSPLYPTIPTPPLGQTCDHHLQTLTFARDSFTPCTVHALTAQCFQSIQIMLSIFKEKFAYGDKKAIGTRVGNN